MQYAGAQQLVARQIVRRGDAAGEKRRQDDEPVFFGKGGKGIAIERHHAAGAVHGDQHAVMAGRRRFEGLRHVGAPGEARVRPARPDCRAPAIVVAQRRVAVRHRVVSLPVRRHA